MRDSQSFFPSPLRLVCDMDGRGRGLRWGNLLALGISVRAWTFDTFGLLLGKYVAHVLDVCVTHGDESRVSTDHSGDESQ